MVSSSTLTKKKTMAHVIKVKKSWRKAMQTSLKRCKFPDAASADAISRIGATSIGEVSLSVASGSHLGVSGQNPTIVAHTSNRESTTALAGSITSHKLEVQADVTVSETASAVTCVSEKSGLIVNDTVSTRALAGSILSYKQVSPQMPNYFGFSYSLLYCASNLTHPT